MSATEANLTAAAGKHSDTENGLPVAEKSTSDQTSTSMSSGMTGNVADALMVDAIIDWNLFDLECVYESGEYIELTIE